MSPVAEPLAVELSLTVLTTWVCAQQESNPYFLHAHARGTLLSHGDLKKSFCVGCVLGILSNRIMYLHISNMYYHFLSDKLYPTVNVRESS